MQIETLIDHPLHRVTAHLPPKPAGTLVITFNPIRKGLADVGFGSGFVKDLGFTHVFVSESDDSQYQDLTPEDLLQVVGPLISAHDRVFLYGSSLGGHAALYYANWLKARAVAISPRLPAHPYFHRYLPTGAGRLGRTPLRHRDLPEIADRSLSPVVLHDPWTAADDGYVKRFVRPAYPEAWFLPVRGAGHRVARVLAYQRRLRPVLSDIFLHNRIPILGYTLASSPRVDLKRAIRALESGHTDSASRWLTRVLRNPATPGLADAVDRYRSLTGDVLAP